MAATRRAAAAAVAIQRRAGDSGHAAVITLGEQGIVAPRLQALAAGGAIVLSDEPAVEPTFSQAFGVFASDAVQLRTGRAFDVWIDPPPPDWALAGIRPPAAVVARWEGVKV